MEHKEEFLQANSKINFLKDLISEDRFNISKIKSLGYRVVYLEDIDFIDEVALKFEVALKLQNISKLYLYERGLNKPELVTKFINSEWKEFYSFSNHIKWPETFSRCFMFDKNLRVIVYRTIGGDHLYICGDSDFIEFLTTTDISDLFDEI
jgi:hypothetical protein